MARKSSHRPDAGKPGTEIGAVTDADAAAAAEEADVIEETSPVDDPTGSTDSAVDDLDAAEDADVDRSLWADVQIDPVEIALPAGVGYTLRAYRLSTEVTPTEISDRDQDDPFAKRRAAAEDEERVIILEEGFTDEDFDTAEPTSPRGRSRDTGSRDDEDTLDEELSDKDELDEEELLVEEEEPEAEEVPVFLSHRGKLLLFKTPEALVSFVRSGASNDLTQVDTWAELTERIQPADIAPLEDDSYELDLVVENLRGGHDAWDPKLLIQAGEVARDLAYAIRLPSVLETLSSGSSLDDLDEALRATVNGGLGGFLGRRRLKKIGAQTASLGWRTIIGKISAAVDWRD